MSDMLIIWVLMVHVYSVLGETADNLCPDVSIPDNAQIINCPKPSQIGSLCVLQCDSGFTPSGSAIRICQYNGKWSGYTFKCLPVFKNLKVIHCPKLSPPADGNISCSARTEVGSICTTLCMEGYETIGGDRHRICLPNQTWSGDPAICKDVVKPRFLSCEDIITVHPHTCSNQTEVHFPYPKVSDNSGNSIIISGYSPKKTLQLGHHFFTYFATDKAGNEDVCKFQVHVAAVVCPAIVKSDCLMVSDASCSTLLGSVACFSCLHGLVLHGRRCIECKANAQWSAPVPTCRCPPLDKPRYGRYEPADKCDSGAPIGLVCTLKCETGYNVTGTDETKCQSDGSWSGSNSITVCHIINHLDHGIQIKRLERDSYKYKFRPIETIFIAMAIILLMILVVFGIIFLPVCVRKYIIRMTGIDIARTRLESALASNGGTELRAFTRLNRRTTQAPSGNDRNNNTNVSGNRRSCDPTDHSYETMLFL